MPRKICVITGSRAEYGLLRPLLRRIETSEKLDLQLIITGAHTSAQHGMTISEIKRDGFSAEHCVDLVLGDSELDVVTSTGSAISQIAQLFKGLKPAIVLLLGDRYETFAAAVAATFLNLPIVHIHGGEVTLGAIDDALRHAITKMSYLHLVSTDCYRQRVIQMGEDPSRVFDVGALGVENVLHEPRITKNELEQSLGINFREQNILITHHPVTSQSAYKNEIDDILYALADFSDIGLIFTSANADAGGMAINEKIRHFTAHHDNASFFVSFGSPIYLSVLAQCCGVVGNSSSGIFEAPLMGNWVLNIGPRQDGRLMPENVISVDSKSNIKQLIKKLLEGKQSVVESKVSFIFGTGDTSRRICKLLEDFDVRPKSGTEFYDLAGSPNAK